MRKGEGQRNQWGAELKKTGLELLFFTDTELDLRFKIQFVTHYGVYIFVRIHVIVRYRPLGLFPNTNLAGGRFVKRSESVHLLCSSHTPVTAADKLMLSTQSDTREMSVQAGLSANGKAIFMRYVNPSVLFLLRLKYDVILNRNGRRRMETAPRLVSSLNTWCLRNIIWSHKDVKLHAAQKGGMLFSSAKRKKMFVVHINKSKYSMHWREPRKSSHEWNDKLNEIKHDKAVGTVCVNFDVVMPEIPPLGLAPGGLTNPFHYINILKNVVVWSKKYLAMLAWPPIDLLDKR